MPEQFTGGSLDRGIIVIADVPWHRGATHSQLADAIKELHSDAPLILNSAAKFKAKRW